VLEGLNPEGAVDKWLEILKSCPLEDEYYRKAQSRIAEYEKRRNSLHE